MSLTHQYPLVVAALRLSKQVAALPGGYLLRNGFRTAQTWLDYQQFQRLKELIARPTMRKLARRQPRLAYKYLMPCMMDKLPRTIRLSIIRYHYEQLGQWMRPDFFNLVLRKQPIWQMEAAGQALSMTLAYPFESDFEGELSLVFCVDLLPVYTVSFTIAPGDALTMAAPSVLLVSRVQGTRNFELIKQITKKMHDTTPAAMLLQAVGGLALACGIGQVAGINTAAQLSRTKAANQFDYDGFWQQLGATPMPRGLYLLPVPLPEKPIELVKANHRARTLRKRQYKQDVRESVAQAVAQLLLAVPCASCPPRPVPQAAT